MLGTRTEKALVFLYTWSVINEDEMIMTPVFRKKTHTDQYINFHSNCPLARKRGVMKTLLHRARTVVSDPNDLEKEKAHIRNALNMNRLLDWFDREC